MHGERDQKHCHSAQVRTHRVPAPASISAEQNRSSSICHDPKPACHVGCRLDSQPPLSHPPFGPVAQPRRVAPGENNCPSKPADRPLPPTLPLHRRRQLPASGTSRASAAATTRAPPQASNRHSIPGAPEGSEAIFFLEHIETRTTSRAVGSCVFLGLFTAEKGFTPERWSDL